MISLCIRSDSSYFIRSILLSFLGPAATLMPHSALFDEAEPLPPPARMLVVDAGYSFTHVIPVIDGQVDHARIRRYAKRILPKIRAATKSPLNRIDVGGKLLTNRLKQVLSHRQFDLSNETYVVNQIREDCCYASLDIRRDACLNRFVLFRLCQRIRAAEPSRIIGCQMRRIRLCSNMRCRIIRQATCEARF